VPDGDGDGVVGQRAGGEHDDGSGDSVSGQRASRDRNTGGELAGVYDGERAGSGRGSNDVDDCAGWICERESGAEPGATPAGLYYTAVFYLSDGTVNTEYWVVPAAAHAALSQVQAQVMPAAQAVQAVSKAYVDESIAEITDNIVASTGGTMTGPLYLSGDPTQPLQAADKHYVDESFALAVPLAGGNMTGPLTTPSVNGVQSPQSVSSQTTLQEAMSTAGRMGRWRFRRLMRGRMDSRM
jgi:hypothetical protein